MGLLEKFIKFTPDEQQQQPQQQNPVQQSPATATQQQPVQQTAYQQQPQPQPQMNVQLPVNQPPVMNPEIVRGLFQDLIDEKSLSAKYMDLKKSAEALSSMAGFNDQQRFQAAFKIMQATQPSLTKDDVLSSIDGYLAKMDEINKLALSQCEEKRNKITSEQKSKVDYNTNFIISKEDEIKKLQTQITNLMTEIEVKKMEIEEMKQSESKEIEKLEFDRAVFEASVAHVKNTLTKDRNIIAVLQ